MYPGHPNCMLKRKGSGDGVETFGHCCSKKRGESGRKNLNCVLEEGKGLNVSVKIQKMMFLH